MSQIVQKTSKSDQKLALNTVEYLKKSETELLKNKEKSVRIQIGNSEELIEIPLKAFLFLRSILSNMAEGKSMILLPTDSELSTQQAAEILKVSRPHIIKLLEAGKIAHRKVGSHRRINLEDLLAYEEELKKTRRKNLDILSKEAQDLNLGY